MKILLSVLLLTFSFSVSHALDFELGTSKWEALSKTNSLDAAEATLSVPEREDSVVTYIQRAGQEMVEALNCQYTKKKRLAHITVAAQIINELEQAASEGAFEPDNAQIIRITKEMRDGMKLATGGVVLGKCIE